MFDFNPTTFGIHMAIEEEASRGVYRYKNLAVPGWFGVNLRPPDFLASPYINNLQAFFHFNQGDCQLVPATHVLNYERCKMDIDRNLYFIKIQCSSVEEARKRALCMAFLTYDMTRHLFVKLATGTMLEDPFIHQSIYQTHELFGYEIKEQDVDVKALIPKQEMQPHQGMISTEKDARALQHSTRFKSVELNEKYLFMSVKDNQEAHQLDKEITKYNNKD